MVEEGLVDGRELLVGHLGQVDALDDGADDGVDRRDDRGLAHPESVPRPRYGPSLMAIACGHCGASHDTVAEVRSCTGTRAPEASLFDEPSYDEASVDEPLDLVWPLIRLQGADREQRPGGARGRRPRRLAGPEELGRALVVGPGQAAPRAWADAPVRGRRRRGGPRPQLVGRLRTAVGEAPALRRVSWPSTCPPGPRSGTTPSRGGSSPRSAFPRPTRTPRVGHAVDLRDASAPTFGLGRWRSVPAPRRQRRRTSRSPTARTPGATAGRSTSSWPGASAPRCSRPRTSAASSPSA